MSEELAQWCGYSCILDMLKDHLTTEELLDLLGEYISENSSSVDEIIEDLAAEKHGWFDEDAARADYEDALYQAYKDGDLR